MGDLILNYRACGAECREDWLRMLANENGLPFGTVQRLAEELGEREDFELPGDFVREIEFYINEFQTVPTYRDFFNRAIRRSRKYIPLLRGTFEEKGFIFKILM